MNASEYRIVEVDDIPGEHEWMLIDEPMRVTFVVKRGCWSAQVVAEGWTAYRSIMHVREEPTAPPHRWLRAV